MSSPVDMERLGRRWAEALANTEPEFDLAASRERFLARLPVGRRRRRWAPVAVAIAALAACAVAITLAMPRVLAPHTAPTPGAWLEAAAGESIPLDFSDGSRVTVHGDSRIRVHSVDPQGARIDLERGTLTAHVVPRADTRWAFQSGPFLVVVTGTQLSIDWSPTQQQFEVRVMEGSVRVTGPMVEGGRSVKAGQRFRVHVPSAHLEITPTDAPQARPSAPPAAPEPQPEAAHDESAPASSGLARAPALTPVGPTWVELEGLGRYQEALRAAERFGFQRIYTTGSSGELLALARAAGYEGRSEVSSQALMSCRKRFAGTDAAARAAYLLGRRAAPRRAAQWFATYLEEAPGGPLAREAAGRLVESYHRAGDTVAAVRAARAYLKQYPKGPHAAFARSIIDASPDEPNHGGTR